MWSTDGIENVPGFRRILTSNPNGVTVAAKEDIGVDDVGGGDDAGGADDTGGVGVDDTEGAGADDNGGVDDVEGVLFIGALASINVTAILQVSPGLI